MSVLSIKVPIQKKSLEIYRIHLVYQNVDDIQHECTPQLQIIYL